MNKLITFLKQNVLEENTVYEVKIEDNYEDIEFESVEFDEDTNTFRVATTEGTFDITIQEV